MHTPRKTCNKTGKTRLWVPDIPKVVKRQPESFKLTFFFYHKGGERKRRIFFLAFFKTCNEMLISVSDLVEIH